MFENELKVVNVLEDLTYDLSEAARNIRVSAQSLECSIEDLTDSSSTPEPDNVDWDWVFDDIASAENDAGIYLEQFDKLLNRVIAARVKLGAFELTASN